MRNLKKTFVSIVLSGACVLSLTATACDNGGQDTHEHTYATTWTFDGTNHWHAATCGDDTKSETAAHTDADNDGKCDVCDYYYPHEHVFDSAWTSDGTGHWHAALCGHDVKGDEEAHTADANGVCTVCGYRVSSPDVSGVEDAIDVALASAGLVDSADGVITYDSEYSHAGISTYTNSAQFHDDYTYLKVTESWTTEYWFTPTEYNRLFVVTSEDGMTPSVSNEVYTEDYLDGYRFTNPSDDTLAYYGVTNYVAGLYNYAKENGLEMTESAEDGVYTFSYDEYVMTYNEQTDDETSAERTPENDRYYTVSVSFTLSENYYIDTMYAESNYYAGDKLDFSAYETTPPTEGTETGEGTEGSETTQPGEDTEPEVPQIGEGTLIENAEPTTTYTYDYTQSVEGKPYDPDEIVVRSFDIVDPDTDEVVSGETEDTASTIEVGLTNNENAVLDITNLQSENADISLDRLTVSMLVYNESSDRYDPAYWGLNTSINTVDNTLTVTGSKAGRYRLIITSTFLGIERYIDVVAAPAAPTAISALVEGNDTDSYTAYEGSGITISSSVAYGYNSAFTASITSDNAADATLTPDASGLTYTFTASAKGTYEVTVVSSADSSVSDTVEIIVADPPALADVFNGTYKMEYSDDNPVLGWNTTAWIMFTPGEGTSGTLSYDLTLSTGGSTTAYDGTCAYTYDEQGNVTISGLAAVGNDESGLTALEIELDNYVPVLSGTAAYMSETWDYETWQTKYVQENMQFVLDGFVKTTDPFPGTGGEQGGAGAMTTDELLTTTTWTTTMNDSLGDPYLHTLIFDAEGWGAVTCGQAIAGSTSVIYFTWTADGTDITVAYDHSVSDRAPDDMPEINDVRATFMTLTDNGEGNYTISWCGVDFNGYNENAAGDATSTSSAIAGKEWMASDWSKMLYFDTEGWGCIFTGVTPDDRNGATVYFDWSADGSDINFAAYSGTDKTDHDAFGDLADYVPIDGLFGTYDAASSEISFFGDTFSSPVEADY